MNIKIKLANALVAYLNAHKGARLDGVTIAAAHKSAALTMPFLSIWVPTAPTHPDFAGIQGAYLPQLCTVEVLMKCHMKGDFEATVATWAAELRDILAAGPDAPDENTVDFAHLIAALNPGEVLATYDVTVNEAGDTSALMPDTTGLSAGMGVSSPDFPSGTTIVSIVDPGSGTIVTFSAGKLTTGTTTDVRFLGAAGAQHPASGLYVNSVCIEDDSNSKGGDCILEHMQLTIVAQSIDPV